MREPISSNAAAQLRMPGMPRPPSRPRVRDRRSVVEGQTVEYLGWVPGGPRFGSQGTVTRTLRRKAVVDLGPAGTWNIPYHFLSVPVAA